MPFERTRSVVQAHAFLTELACDTEVPERVRKNAHFLLRHFPTKQDVLQAGRIEEQAKKLGIGTFGPVFSSSTEHHIDRQL
ncbi:BPSL0761 family protein [Pseudomonas sp. Irchel s3f7]|uniref:BPSL0761 family protein n=1 Tax=Pseudomonas sp. Irchel s3f7 TaxID=2009153 RepID=UPI00273A5FB6|nr:BPSL0761 family protein [Pseudomonas sp. Irchel s3f7]